MEIDTSQKMISIEDNGIGINPNDLPILLRSFSTNKRNNEATIGKKGVGFLQCFHDYISVEKE